MWWSWVIARPSLALNFPPFCSVTYIHHRFSCSTSLWLTSRFDCLPGFGFNFSPECCLLDCPPLFHRLQAAFQPSPTPEANASSSDSTLQSKSSAQEFYLSGRRNPTLPQTKTGVKGENGGSLTLVVSPTDLGYPDRRKIITNVNPVLQALV